MFSPWLKIYLYYHTVRVVIPFYYNIKGIWTIVGDCPLNKGFSDSFCRSRWRMLIQYQQEHDNESRIKWLKGCSIYGLNHIINVQSIDWKLAPAYFSPFYPNYIVFCHCPSRSYFKQRPKRKLVWTELCMAHHPTVQQGRNWGCVWGHSAFI